MKSFNKKVLASAVMATMAGAAHAVYVDNNGLGQALIYPHYTVQNGHNTYVSVVNTTSSVKVVKVRFREGKNSREVLDFNLYLSPNDVWTGAVIPSTVTTGARLITGDVSCTNPAIPAAGVDFRNYLYSGTNTDNAGSGLDRTREGYLEMIEMGVLNPLAAPGSAAVHSSTTGVPSCTGLRGVTVANVASAIGAPTGGLMGTGTLINVSNGQDSGFNALALSNLTAAAIYADIGNDAPNLSAADPVSLVVSGNRAYSSTFATGRDAVSSVVMHSSVLNEFVLDTPTNSNTDWVLTFPTKQFYVGASAARPFTNAFTSAGACESIGFTFYDREERSVTPTDVDFSPLPPGAAGSSVCWESTVLSIRNGVAHTTASGTASGVLGSVNSTAVSVNSTFQNGWAALTFAGANSLLGIGAASGTTTNLATNATSQAAPTFIGLPVVGFMVRTFNNGTLGNFQANYGSAFEHKYRQSITPTP